MGASQRRRSPRRHGRANSGAERRALAKASGRRPTLAPPAPRPGHAVLATDGGSRGNPGPGAVGYGPTAPPGPPAIGYVRTAAAGATLATRGEAIGVAGATVAEYSAVLAGLAHARCLGL